MLRTIEPGDVLVAPFTTPAYNTVLTIAGAIVVEEGGVLCHAAVMARELEIPAVIGAQGAMTRIDDGAMVEVDPVAGRVRVVAVEGVSLRDAAPLHQLDEERLEVRPEVLAVDRELDGGPQVVELLADVVAALRRTCSRTHPARRPAAGRWRR